MNTDSNTLSEQIFTYLFTLYLCPTEIVFSRAMGTRVAKIVTVHNDLLTQ